MNDEQLLQWLLEGDVSIRYQAGRDLLGTPDPALQARIPTEGWGARFLAARQETGHWGQGFYQPKWISSHYTLLDLRYLNLPPDHATAHETIQLILTGNQAEDGGINPGKTIKESDICVNGMFLTYACYFQAEEDALHAVIDFVLAQQMPDGGFNCRKNRSGAVHSSLHSTISMLEGLHEYAANGYTYRLAELQRTAADSREFVLQHRLFRSDHTGAIINKNFLMLSYPSRWYYDILRALVYFRGRGHRLRPAHAGCAGRAVAEAAQRRPLAGAGQTSRPDSFRHGKNGRSQPLEHAARAARIAAIFSSSL